MEFDEILNIANECENEINHIFVKINQTAYKNTEKVMTAFRKNKISAHHFSPSTGYGYDDAGRDICDVLFAECFNAEAGFARHNIISGTHAIAIGLFGLLRPNDTMYSATGTPYDTLDSVIGTKTNKPGSLRDFGVKYLQCELTSESKINIKKIAADIQADNSIKVVFVQRSKGYQDRKTLSYKEIDELYHAVKEVSDAYVFVDNNYGEFCEEKEPTADLLCGSLIKNAGGGMCDSGGYIVGSKKAVELASYRLTVPGIGLEAGASLGMTRQLIKGLFYAPHTTAEALKTAVFAAALFQKLGYGVYPLPADDRFDIIQMLYLQNEDNLINFCRAIQEFSPIDSSAVPYPSEMPGYDDKVIMAAGTFVSGASIELSADAPLRGPYNVFLQGGLTYESGKYAVINAAHKLKSQIKS